MGGNKGVMLLLATLVLATVCGICCAKSVVVGGSTGWGIPNSASFYPNWASQQLLQVGDVLVFNFQSGAHTVAEVSKANYDSCSIANTIGPVLTSPPANITLTKPGTHYFICTVTGHCGQNQKLTVTATASPTATPAPQPSPSSKKSPTPSPTTTPTSSPIATSPTPSTSKTLPVSPVAMGPTTTPPPADNFAVSSGVSVLSLLFVVVAALVLVF